MSWVNLLDIIYPVGSIYCSILAISPAELIGGSWSKIDNAVLRSSDDTSGYTGSDSHTITINEMPSHSHVPQVHGVSLSSSGVDGIVHFTEASGTGTATSFIGNTGGGQEMSLIQRSYNCHIWYRTA